MNSNQSTIKTHLEAIHADITKYLPNIITYQAAVKEAERTYSQQYAEQAKRSSLERLTAISQNTRDSIQSHIESIRAAAVELEHQPFVGALTSSVMLIGAATDKLPLAIKESIIQPFIGNKQALVSLQAVFEANGVALPRFDDSGDILSRYIFDAEAVCNTLSNIVYDAFIKPESNALLVLGLWKHFTHFGELEGIQISLNFDDDPNAIKFYNDAMRTAAGLEVK